ncbi:hypothetical protein [Bradyrhizobium sp. SZCCHNR1051]|uniref:hypothetical protein n=1 Tax=Bradyrhizobium sp. SZCCHNR1051 TaxID=3057355 RepID=UPI002916F5E6|nr:hypothetical protein [Bradyrhizobium sp. SZCCHNR1051]
MTTEDDARKVLTAERAARVYRAVRQAWDDVQQDIARYPHWPRTRAGMVFERLKIRLQEQFATDTGVHFTFADETMKMVFDGKLVARCKKADSRGLGHNVPTGANDLFLDQQTSLFDPQDKIEIVYVLNLYATDIKQILVQARDGDVRLWAYEIDDAALGTSAPVTPLPTPPAPPSTSADDLVQPRVKPIVKDESDKNQ